MNLALIQSDSSFSGLNFQWSRLEGLCCVELAAQNGDALLVGCI